MSRVTDNDYNFWIFTAGKTRWSRFCINYTSGGRSDDDRGNALYIWIFGYVLRVSMPNILKPYREYIDCSGYSWSREGSGYWDVHPKEYGFSFSEEGFFQIYFGAQTHDSTTTRSWCCHLPWTQWRHIRTSVYDAAQNLFYDEGGSERDFNKFFDAKEKVSKVKFEFDDFDGERIIAETHIEEREWLFGVGYFKWLSFFRKPLVRRSLQMNFDKEVGTEKGSWKGGIVGTGIEMNAGESHIDAFKRFCDLDHKDKGRNYRLKFIGECNV